MPSANSNIQFKYGLKTNYTKLAAKDVNTIYFCTDTQELFVGDTEYTRPVQFGTALPTTFVPPNSLFYKTDTKELYFSEGGTKWTPCSNFYSHPTFTAKTVGANTAGAVAHGGSFKIPKVTVNSQGHVSAAEDVTITLPAETKNSVTVSGAGNAVTAAAWDAAGHALTLTKGETFATKAQLDAAIGNITSFELDAGPEGKGYASLEALKTAHAKGVKGTIYLVQAGSKDTNSFAEYLWTGSAYEQFGTFGDVDLSGYVPTSRTVNGHALTGNVTVTKADVGLGNVDNTADSTKVVASAGKLTTPRTIKLTGNATGSVSFDGSNDASIAVTVSESAHAAAADSAIEADHAAEAGHATSATSANSATKATQDGAGNVIASTYATKAEVKDASLKWGSF